MSSRATQRPRSTVKMFAQSKKGARLLSRSLCNLQFQSSSHRQHCRRLASNTTSDSFKQSSQRLGGWLWLVPVTTFGLGCWQVYRLQWKLDLIEKFEWRLKLPPVDLTTVKTLDKGTSIEDEYLRVKTTGKFNPEKTILLGPRTRNDEPIVGGGLISGSKQVGFYVLTPFTRSDDGSTILVNRGWIPREIRDDFLEMDKEERKGPVTIEGVVKSGEPGSIFMPSNKPEKNEWYWTDLKHMAEIAAAKPVLLEMTLDSSINEKIRQREFPAERRPHANFRNSHLQYAITWYGLCIFSSAMLWKSRRMPGRLPTRS
ncbi:SURF1 family-domain-containing protein [Phlyctochytrium arcticum]|nr:SURF1 family-domain-containing protein [Phlyctochytrium arcticum]